MKTSQHYLKIVSWSEDDQCFIGQCPGIIGPCCHGNDEAQVYAELCQIVEEWLERSQEEGKPLPPPTAERQFVEKLLNIMFTVQIGGMYG